jgi:flagellar motility protein MotE (MotC chaperone)
VSNQLQKKNSTALKEKTQYGLTFGVIATMLFVAGFPMIVIFFFGVFAYFLWKTFSQPSHQGVKKVFEFYLAANEILRNDERRWFGFEVQEVIAKGERILKVMQGAPPLVYFTLGALYNKIENHEAAVNHLSYVVENESSDEGTYVHPSNDLREYVHMLRKIEREPKNTPQTAAAIRSLERARKNRGTALLEESRKKFEEFRVVEAKKEKKQLFQAPGNSTEQANDERLIKSMVEESSFQKEEYQSNNRQTVRPRTTPRKRPASNTKEDDLFANRKPITEVLHDIYDKNLQ